MKKRILHVTHGFFPNKGFEVYLKNLINNLTEFTHIVTVFPGTNNDIGLNHNIEIIELKSLYDIKDICDSKRIDIVNIHWTGVECFDKNFKLVTFQDRQFLTAHSKKEINLDADPYGYVHIPLLWDTFINTGKMIHIPAVGDIIRSRNIPERILNPDKPKFVITCHSDYKLSQVLSTPIVDLVISVSRKTMFRQSHLNTEHQVIYNSLDMDIPSEDIVSLKEKISSEKTDSLKVLFVGQLCKYDMEVYQAIKEDKEINSKCEFIYLGSGSLDPDPLPNHKFIGEVPHDEVYKYLLEADIFLYPTTMDSFSIALIEAMFFKVPCIASEEVKETLDDFGGYVYKDISEVLNFMNNLIRNAKLRVKLGNEGHYKVVKDYCFYTMINRYKEAYNNLLKK